MAPPAWQHSEAKKLLTDLYRDKHSWIHLCLPEQIHDTEPLFKQYPWGRFRDNFNRLMKKLDEEEDCVAFDQAAFDQYKTKYTRANTTNRGEPFWDGHPAQGLLKAFVKQQRSDRENGMVERNKLPAEVYALQAAYRQFTLESFRNHYYREMRALREAVYWQKKRNKEGQKKHDQAEEKREMEA